MIRLSPCEIAEQILDISNWTDFHGYGPLPGITAAEFEIRTPDVVGSRIRVCNSDGSTHVEEITEWCPDERIALKMQDFSAPLSNLATGIDEVWEFNPSAESTKVIRSFQMHPKSTLARPVLWLVSRLLKRAINRHLHEMKDAAET